MGLPFSFHGGGTFKDEVQVACKVNNMLSPYFVCFLVLGCAVTNHNTYTEYCATCLLTSYCTVLYFAFQYYSTMYSTKCCNNPICVKCVNKKCENL